MAESILHPQELQSLLNATHDNPFAALGRHRMQDGKWVVRSLRPDAAEVSVIDAGEQAHALERVHQDGFFEGVLPGETPLDGHTLRVQTWDGREITQRDPYSFDTIIGPLDVHLFAEGNHYDIYKHLGAHLREIDGAKGVAFAVWAPNAQRVSVVGDWNAWDGRVHPMRKLLGSGIWEIFIPGLEEEAHYKFEVRTCHGDLVLKTDPFAFYAQHGKQTAAMVFDLDRYRWDDDEWMQARQERQWHREAMSVYEVHLGSWQRIPEEGDRYLSYKEFAERLVPHVKEMGFTHIELMPVAEHPFDGSWGYQLTGFYAPTSRFGNPDEFRNFVEICHQNDIGVIMDWVPGHFPKDEHGLARFDGTHLYEHADPRQGEHVDWGTLIFNYGRNEVRNFLLANALFWLREYHIDGLRVDAVASMLYLDYSREEGEWIPNCYGGRENLEAIHFLQRTNELVYGECPGVITAAEESTSYPMVTRPVYLGGLGFGFKWNMGWMNDSLRYISLEPVHRKYHQSDLTFSLIYSFSEHFILVLSHDEVVHGKGSMLGKMPGDRWQKFANLRMFYAYMWFHPGKKLLFMGNEFGQSSEWSHGRSLDWHLNQYPEHDGLKRMVQQLNAIYKEEQALWEFDDSYEGFQWIDFEDADSSVLAFARFASNGDCWFFAMNATPVAREGYRFGVPKAGYYKEVLNTDAETYGGSNQGNMGGCRSEPVWWQGRSDSMMITLPPLAAVGFKWQPDKEEEKPLLKEKEPFAVEPLASDESGADLKSEDTRA